MRRFVLVLAAVLAAADGAAADTRLPDTGGRGGGPFEASCEGGILRGVELRTADDVDAIRPICASLRSPSETFDERVVGPWRGGTGGEPRQVVCPADRPAVYAMRVGVEGDKTLIVNSIAFWCGNADGGYRRPVDDTPQAEWAGPSVGNGGFFSTRFAGVATHACPPGEAAGGLHGRHGIWLDAVGISCVAYRAPAAAPDAPTGRRIGKRTSGPAGPPPPPPTAVQGCQAARKAVEQNKPLAQRAILEDRCLTNYPDDNSGDPDNRDPCSEAKLARAQGRPYGEELTRCFASLPPL